MGSNRTLITADGTANATDHYLVASYKTKHTLTIGSRVTLLDIYPNKLKTCPHKTYTQIFVAALFIIARNWKQMRCPSEDELINCSTLRQWNIIQH